MEALRRAGSARQSILSMAKQEKWVGRFVGVPGNSSASYLCSRGDSQVPANAHKLTVSRHPWQIGRCWYFLQSSEYSIFPPWSILNSLRFRPSSVVGITVHWLLLFNYSPNINWASPMLSTALVSRYIVVNFFFFLLLWKYYWTQPSSFSICLTQASVSNAKWQAAVFKISFVINVEFRAHGTMGISYEWRLRDLNVSSHAAKT